MMEDDTVRTRSISIPIMDKYSDNGLAVDASRKTSLLLSILPHRLQYLSIAKSHVPALCHTLLRLILSAVTPEHFLSFAETDDSDVSLLLDSSLLTRYRNSSAPMLATVVGPPLRAIQVLEGSDGFVNTAIIATVSTQLAAAGFSIFYVSTNSADYVLVQDKQLRDVISSMQKTFHLTDDDIIMQPELAEPPTHTHHNTHSGTNGIDHHRTSAPIPVPTRLSSSHTQTDKLSLPNADGHLYSLPRSTSISLPRSASNISVDDPILLPLSPLSTLPRIASTSLHSSVSLRVLPYELIMYAMDYAELAMCMSSLLTLIFFPPANGANGFYTSPTFDDSFGREVSGDISAVSPLSPSSPPPSRFFSYTCIGGEFSLILDVPSYQMLVSSVRNERVKSVTNMERWTAIKALGEFAYDESGLVSAISRPLTDAQLNFFYFSTFRTGFVLVPTNERDNAREALAPGFTLL